MKRNWKSLVLSLFLVLAVLSGCSAINQRLEPTTGGESGGKAPVTDGVIPDESFAPNPMPPDDKTQNLDNEQKLVKSASIELSAKDIQSAQTEIDLIARRYSGYVFHMQQSQTPQKRYLTITIKVATANFDAAIADIRKLGTATNVTFDVSDVTTQFIDTEARIKTLKTKEQTLITILAKASEIEDILAIETSLQQTRQEIESYEGQLNVLKNSTNFSRITVQVTDETGLVTTEEPESAWDRFRTNFEKGLRYWADTAVDVVSGFLFLLPVLIPLAVILLILRYFVRKNPRHWTKVDRAALYGKTTERTTPPASTGRGPDKGPKDPTGTR